jgi:hypothetical protein
MEGIIANLIIQVIAGAIGGTAAGNALKDLSMGKASDAISGAVGGGVVGQILMAVLGGRLLPTALAQRQDWISGVVVVGGAVVMAIIGALRDAMMKG